MDLKKVRTIKSFLYEYKSAYEKKNHKKNMLLAKFQVEKESELSVEFSQVIKESE